MSKIVTVQPSSISGSLFAPASKSSMQRACAAALVKKGISYIHNPGTSNDDKAALDIIQKLGAATHWEGEVLVIESNGVAPINDTIHCGESGLSIRMFTPIAALAQQPVTITGEGSLVTRPMDFFDNILPQLSVRVNSKQGKLPLQVHGPLQPANITIDGSLSSQFLTGLLMAFAADAHQLTAPVTITVDQLKSKPYIDLTLHVMQQFGLPVPVHHQHERFTFHPQPVQQAAVHYTVEGDWSGAAFLLVAGAVAATDPIVIKGLDVFSTQADKQVLQALMDCGCKLSVQADQIEVGKAPLQAFHFNATDCPDLFPPLVALAAYCKGTTAIEGVTRLAHKESNRALTLQQEFGKLGVNVVLQDDLMLIEGGKGVTGGNVHSHHDHRIAMACAVAALSAQAAVVIEGAEAINKSYPGFYQHLQKLGTSLQ
jgi:3-phosphoshikimate 1-carboxyvinyltransferase